MSVLGEIAWMIIRPVVTALAESGASPATIYEAAMAQIAKLNYIGGSADWKFIFDNVARVIQEHGIVGLAYLHTLLT